METKHLKMQRFIRFYKDQTGKTEVSMREVAQFAEKSGWTLPVPMNAIDLLAKEFAQAAREEIRYDKKTKKPYRANHAVPVLGTSQPHLWNWIDIDDPRTPRKLMVKSLFKRREGMVADGVQLSFDADHWNSNHPKEEPIQIPMDFTDDILWRKNAPPEELDKAS